MPYYPQPVTVKDAGATVGTQPAINFIEGTNVTITLTDDPSNNEVDVEIAASGGGTPAGSDTQIQYNNAGAFGASAYFRYGTQSSLTGPIVGSPGNSTPIMASDGDSGNLNGTNFTLLAGQPFDNSTDPANGGGFNNTAQDGIHGGSGGPLDLSSGGSDSGAAGTLTIYGGYSESGQGAHVEIYGGGTDTGTSGDISLIGYTPDTSGNGSNINITIGQAGGGGGSNGNLIITGLPTSDPGVSGALWIDGSNFLKVSP